MRVSWVVLVTVCLVPIGAPAWSAEATTRDAEPQRVRLVKPAASIVRRASPWTLADRSALRGIQKEGRERVRKLVEQFNAAHGADSRHAISQQIIETKKTFRLRFLNEIVTRALLRGDLDLARTAQKVIDGLTRPPVPAVVGVDQIEAKRRAIESQEQR